MRSFQRTPGPLVDLDLADPLGQRRVEQRGRAGRDQAAELRDQAGGAARLRPARPDRIDAHREHVALAGAFDQDRPALRVDERHGEHPGRQVGLGLHGAAERVQGLDHDRVARLHPQHGRGIGPVDIMEPALRRLGQLVGRAGPPRRAAAPRHDRLLVPAHAVLPSRSLAVFDGSRLGMIEPGADCRRP